MPKDNKLAIRLFYFPNYVDKVSNRKVVFFSFFFVLFLPFDFFLSSCIYFCFLFFFIQSSCLSKVFHSKTINTNYKKNCWNLLKESLNGDYGPATHLHSKSSLVFTKCSVEKNKDTFVTNALWKNQGTIGLCYSKLWKAPEVWWHRGSSD